MQTVGSGSSGLLSRRSAPVWAVFPGIPSISVIGKLVWTASQSLAGKQLRARSEVMGEFAEFPAESEEKCLGADTIEIAPTSSASDLSIGSNRKWHVKSRLGPDKCEPVQRRNSTQGSIHRLPAASRVRAVIDNQEWRLRAE
jgi:hypothetical protein